MKFLDKSVERVQTKKGNELLWILEHNTVYTAGTSSKEEDLIDKNLQIIRTNRGGKLTLHSPGQKVIYFVLNLNKRDKDIRKLVNQIEKCIINVLKEYQVNSYADKKNIGIWVKEKKIAAIGIKVKRWIAYHGFSINVYNDLNVYNSIVPCGIKNKGITSLKEIGINNYANINEIIKRQFLNTFF